MKGRQFCIVAAAALLAVAALAPSAEAGVGEPERVTCMYPVWVGFGPVHLANELGYFEEEGIAVDEILDDDMPNGVNSASSASCSHGLPALAATASAPAVNPKLV